MLAIFSCLWSSFALYSNAKSKIKKKMSYSLDETYYTDMLIDISYQSSIYLLIRYICFKFLFLLRMIVTLCTFDYPRTIAKLKRKNEKSNSQVT